MHIHFWLTACFSTEASESLDPPEPQEHDGMAYPCNPYIEARGAKANKDDAGSESNAGAEVGKS